MALSAIDLYFKDPQEPLRLFKELEEENLFLIQNAHETVIVRLRPWQDRQRYFVPSIAYHKRICCCINRCL